METLTSVGRRVSQVISPQKEGDRDTNRERGERGREIASVYIL